MKQSISKQRKSEYIPDVLATEIEKLSTNTSGYSNVRYDNFLKIVGTIYYKCIRENDHAFIPYPLAKKYWVELIGGRYKEYLDELIKADIVVSTKTGRRLKYNIDFNLILQPTEIIRVEYRTVQFQQSEDDQGISHYEIDRIENRLGKQIIKHLNRISVDYDAFETHIKNGSHTIDPDDFLIDISNFSEDMDFRGVIHYPNDIQSHYYKIKKLVQKSSELGYPTFYDKDRIRIIDNNSFRQNKTHSFLIHSKLNLKKLIDGQYELSRDSDKTRRVFHVLVFLPSKTLQFIKIDGQPVVGIDAKTSQFLLLANLFKSFVQQGDSIANNFTGRRKTFIKNLHNIFKNNQELNKNDVELFFHDVVENDFYEVVRKELNLSQRNQAKIFCFSIIFSKPASKNEFKQTIRSRYPAIIGTLDAFKREYGYKELSINLQALEAEIFIEGIFNKLHKKGITCFTRHDSVVVGDKNVSKALKLAEEHFIQLGFSPKFKTENYEIIQDDNRPIPSYPDELNFLYDVEVEDDINNLNTEELFTLLENGKSIFNENNYNHIESRIIELNKNNLPLDKYSIKLLYDLTLLY
jgi:hypothetical protein